MTDTTKKDRPTRRPDCISQNGIQSLQSAFLGVIAPSGQNLRTILNQPIHALLSISTNKNDVSTLCSFHCLKGTKKHIIMS